MDRSMLVGSCRSSGKTEVIQLLSKGDYRNSKQWTMKILLLLKELEERNSASGIYKEVQHLRTLPKYIKPPYRSLMEKPIVGKI